MSNRSYDIFISYSRKDKEIARIICDRLSQNGISCFFDLMSIQGGDEYQEIIIESIEKAKVFLIICTPDSMQSTWVLTELEFAQDIKKEIIPIIVDDTQLSGALYFHLGRLNSLCIDSKNIEQGLSRLERDLHRLLKRSEPKPTAEPTQQAIPHDESIIKATVKTEEPTQNKKLKEGKAKRVLSTIGIALTFIFYILAVNMSFANHNYIEGCLLLIPLILLGAYCCFRIRKSRKFSLKLYCETEGDCDSTLVISIDGEVVKTIKGKGFARIVEKKGDYLISIESDNKEIVSEKFIHTFNTQNNDTIKSITLKRTSSAPQNIKENDITRYMCFIAGSTGLTNQRNAIRAILSILYNKWEQENLVISAYTFEDFSAAYTVGGQQMEYDKFIKTKANCAIFIVENGIGPKTLGEYRLAMDTFKESQQRPRVFVYANNLNSTDKYTKEFIEEAHKDNCYWREYRDISSLMDKAQLDLDSELFRIFKIMKHHNQ